MPFLHPSDAMNDSDAPRRDTAVNSVDGLIDADRRIGEGPGFLIGCEQFDVVAQRTLITLQDKTAKTYVIEISTGSD
jgi:hypothetical protein